MRPPSYYASIVKNNNSNYDYSSTTATTRSASQQLRSSLSSPSSASYASRSHLPFVSQSALVAHCYTSNASSSPRSTTSTTYNNYSTSSSNNHRTTTNYTSTRTNPYISSSPSTSAYYVPSSSRPPSTKRQLATSAYTSSVASHTYQRPTTTTSYFSPRSSYTRASSSYYQPIRLRERPLLTQISRQLNTPSNTNTTNRIAKSSSPPPPDHSNASDSVRVTQQVSCTVEEPNKAVESSDKNKSTTTTGTVDWLADVGRNISRNKYLIKFREFDKQRRPSSAIDSPIDTSQAALSRELQDETRTRDDRVPDREPAGRAKSADTLGESHTSRDLHHEFNNNQIESESCDKNKMVVVQEEETKTTSAPKRPLVAKKKNVKLKLRPIVKREESSLVADVNLTSGAEDQVKIQNIEKNNQEEKQTKNRVKKSATLSNESKNVVDLSQASVGAEKKPKLKNKKLTSNNKLLASKEKEEEKKQAQETKLIELNNKENETRPNITPSDHKHKLKVSPPTESSSNRIRFREYNHNDFNFLTVLGHGGWGFVILAELKEHDACFAVKCIKKITIVEDDDYDSIMIERKMLALGNLHPFICKLFCTFETEGYLFFVMEYCPGGDLMFHVQKEGKFNESRCRFYAAEIICAIRFLHNRHIIYRDLKLDNILLDARGHIRLVDFGMCQCRTYREEMLPSNFCGTPEYISPEIIKGVPYNHSVDWWSFGVLLYEMAVGKMPFRGNDENELLWNVCYEQIHYPMFLSKELTNLLKLLLEREPEKRMGMATCKAGDIYEQAFFRSVNWKDVEQLRVEPPFVPEVASNRDVRNFDSDFTESACELSPVDEKTLAKIDQKQFAKFPYTNPDIFYFDNNQRQG